MWRQRLVLAVALLICSIDLPPAAVAGSHHAAHDGTAAHLARQSASSAATATALTLEVDGVQAPAAVPLDVAARMFVRSLQSANWREYVVGALDLSQAERAGFQTALGRVPEVLAANATDRRARLAVLSSATDEERAALAVRLDAVREQEDALLDDTYAALRSALSPPAADRLAAHVETRVRSRIRLYSVPGMPHGAAAGGH